MVVGDDKLSKKLLCNEFLFQVHFMSNQSLIGLYIGFRDSIDFSFNE